MISVPKITNRKFGIRLARLAGEKIRPRNASSKANSWINHDANSYSSAFASFKSRVSNPSVNQTSRKPEPTIRALPSSCPGRARGGREPRLRTETEKKLGTGEPRVAQACSRAKSRSRVLGSMAVATMLTMAQPKM